MEATNCYSQICPQPEGHRSVPPIDLGEFSWAKTGKAGLYSRDCGVVTFAGKLSALGHCTFPAPVQLGWVRGIRSTLGSGVLLVPAIPWH